MGPQGPVPHAHAHGPAQDNGDSPSVKSSVVKETECKTEEGDSLAVRKKELDSDLLEKLKPSASVLLKAANSKLNADAMAYTMPGATVETLYDGGLLPKPSHSAPSHFRLNAEAAVFKPSLLGIGSLVPVQLPLPVPQSLLPAVSLPLLPAISQGVLAAVSQPLLPTPSHFLDQDFPPLQGNHHHHHHHHQLMHPVQRHGGKPYVRWRKQPLPDLFTAVLSLIKEQSRSVSYPEIINTLALRLQRPEVELKRHVPHTLHAAVNNGYLKKDGNRYTLVSEMEQLEIMRRNQEAAMRAKELEKEPLSWRKR